MADISTTQKLARESKAGQLAKERILWAIKPFGFLGIMLWILTPTTADRQDLESTAMLAFLFGAVYGAGCFYNNFKYHLILRQSTSRNTRNRMPHEYYWGQVADVRATR